MSAFDDLDKKFEAGDMTYLDLCIFWHVQEVPEYVARRAANELAKLRAALDGARRIIKSLPYVYPAAAAWLKANPPAA